MKKLTALVAAMAIAFFPAKARRLPDLEARFLDVGEGDAALITTPAGRNIMIDCGPGYSQDKVISYLRNRNVQNIEVLLVSHPDSDHMGGCAKIIENFHIGRIYDSDIPPRKNSKDYQEYLAARKKAEYSKVSADIGIQIGEGVTLYFIVPYDRGIIADDRNNNNSVLAAITYGNVSYLFAGDCERECERVVIGNVHLDADVLKAAHHGSQNSSSPEFLGKVTPKAVVVSVGQNVHGHPSGETMNRLTANCGGKLFITMNGDVACDTDGKKLACKYKR